MQTIMTCGSLFLEGLLSFFSPCVLPIVPLYIGYLTKDAKSIDENGNTQYSRKKTLFFTIFFIFGILFVYVLAGLSTGIIHDFFTDHKIVFSFVGGMILILLGLLNLHIIRIPFLENTHQKMINLQGTMTWCKAWLLGFFFSFAWSPCTGPMLAQAIVLASGAENKFLGWIYLFCYAIGFIVIFLLLGLFTEEMLNILKKYKNVVKYTSIISGILVLGCGCYMLYNAYQEYEATISTSTEETTETEETSEEEKLTIDDLDFTLKDIDGNEHSLSDYKGKTIVLNFFGTWCYYCNEEFPSLQSINDSDGDTKVLMVAAPGVNSEGDQEYIDNYMKEAGYDLDIVFDTDLSVTNQFGVSGYPCSFIFKPDGDYLGYIPGYIEHENLLEIIQQAKE